MTEELWLNSQIDDIINNALLFFDSSSITPDLIKTLLYNKFGNYRIAYTDVASFVSEFSILIWEAVYNLCKNIELVKAKVLGDNIDYSLHSNLQANYETGLKEINKRPQTQRVSTKDDDDAKRRAYNFNMSPYTNFLNMFLKLFRKINVFTEDHLENTFYV